MTSEFSEVKYKELCELNQMYRHHDVIVWTLAGFILPATVAVSYIGLKTPELRDIALIFSLFLLLLWFLSFERIRMLMQVIRDRTSELENDLKMVDVWEVADTYTRSLHAEKFLGRHENLASVYFEIRHLIVSVQFCVRVAVFGMVVVNLYLLFSGLHL